MTKKINLSAIVLLVFTLLISVSCTKENDLTNDDAFNRKFNIKSIESNKTSLTNYKIITANSSIDFANEQINLEIPVPLNDYHFAKAYNVSTSDQAAVLLILSRNSTELVKDLPTNYTIDTNISFEEINLDANFLEGKPNLTIFVMNNVRALDDNDAIIQSFTGTNTNYTNKNDSADGPLTTKDGFIIINN